MSVVRHWIEELLPGCDARDMVTLVASELCANAIRHTASGLPGGRFGLAVTWAAESILVEVGDGGGPSVPVVIDDADGEGGRGLQLVRALSDALSVLGDQKGRAVSANIPWAANGGPPPQVSEYETQIAVAVASLHKDFPWAVIWFGLKTRRWWAALSDAAGGDQLVEAPTSGAMAAALNHRRGASARSSGVSEQAGPASPGQLARCPDRHQER